MSLASARAMVIETHLSGFVNCRQKDHAARPD